MIYLLKMPNGKLAAFDAFHHEFERLDIDPASDLKKTHADLFENLSQRLFGCEVEHALKDLSLDGSDWPAHPEGLNRWEGVVRDLVEETSLEDAQEVLEAFGLTDYAIPEAIATEARAREAKQAAEQVRYVAFASRPSPYVNTVNDESVWAEI